MPRPLRQCHPPGGEATANGDLLAVWCAQPKGSHLDHAYGALSSDGGENWSKARILIEDPVKADGDPNILVDGRRVMVFSTRANEPNRIDKSWIIMISSDDFGRTWSSPSELVVPRQYLAGKQHNGIKLRDGTLMMGISWDKWPEMGMAARTEGEMDNTTGVLLSKDGRHWTLHGAIHAFVEEELQGRPMDMRTISGGIGGRPGFRKLLRSGSSHHYESRSDDSGVSWSKPVPSPLPGHNTPCALWRLDENPGEIIVVWNNSPLTRYPLSTAISADGGRTWSRPRAVAETDGT